MAERIYIVTDKRIGTKRMVQACSQYKAIRHVASDTFTVDVASALDVAFYMTSGMLVETCDDKQAELPIEDAA
jgi:hypothetical protein